MNLEHATIPGNHASIIPEPAKMTFNLGNFVLNDNTSIQSDTELRNISEYLRNLISPPTGFQLKPNITDTDDILDNAINLVINEEREDLGDEGYCLITTNDYILISAPKPAGVFYGIQTLRQLFPIEIEKRFLISDIEEWVLPGVTIEDYPRFSWRGFMLDEGRHFLGKAIVKRMLDLLALHKLNVFHWHLTEDQGWRIEIKKYPRLAEVGSYRKGTQIGGIRSFLTKEFDSTPHGGYYTQTDIKEILSYAQERFITIIPEIDMPGHSMAVLAVYPEYSCAGGPFKVQTTFGIKKDVLCPGKENVFRFLQDVLDELINIFPSKFIHIGGDEVPKSRWKKCPDCQARITTENLDSEGDLQTYFINRIASYLLSKGRVPIGWNDILDKNLRLEVIGQHWFRGNNKVLDHLRKGRKFVISRFFYTYLDYPYTMTPLRKVYSINPIPEKLEKVYHENILGIEAPVWSEWISTIDRLDWQVFPRLTALAETGWILEEKKNYFDFKKRLERFLQRLEVLGVKNARLNQIDPGFFKRLFLPLTMLRDPQKNVSTY
ncbi:MAG: beta-N-acetylhexosaminidase [Candidatus Hermodarchaeota archaeon]